MLLIPQATPRPRSHGVTYLLTREKFRDILFLLINPGFLPIVRRRVNQTQSFIGHERAAEVQRGLSWAVVQVSLRDRHLQAEEQFSDEE
ncbi:MAG: hypothetical protein COY66_02900 [Candidatus Kerfeldbacteria bacterium CG_4_10_14_0_8_um_filter_42_10]|uniref:Uncharacterized protein n=1 Tax=Candidatus Kerfeldbacteria bacterium CG_4_10_14_0_8_um_filter_42_10 TaxID=2014248 RepID=A0A2M7RJR5_9BACT|nr:MAG: hypothetical protein COY66_02900 [Candidatus Kerfeldbacteria bacterium CG_4_10_14_0_8_um_filter_42_10]